MSTNGLADDCDISISDAYGAGEDMRACTVEQEAVKGPDELSEQGSCCVLNVHVSQHEYREKS